MFASDYRDEYAEESEDMYEDDQYRSDFESMLSANNSIDDQIKVSYNKDFTDDHGAQGYDDDFYNESQQGSSVVKSANLQEFSSVTFYKSQLSPAKETPEESKPVKKKVKRKQTPKETKETKSKPARNENEGANKPNTSERRAVRQQTPKEANNGNKNTSNSSNNNNNNNNNNETDDQYHKYKRYEVRTPQMTEINTRTVIPITSHVVKDLRHNSFSIQRQLDLALKKIESYKNENSILRSKLDSSNIEAAVERYKGALLEKEIKITQLQEENNSLKMVARHQSKGLMKNDYDKQHQPEREMSQDRQIEILMEHIKKLKTKIEDYKCMEKQLTDDNSTLKAQNGKLSRRVTKLKRQLTELTNGPHRSPGNKPDLLDMINHDLSKADSSLVEGSFKIGDGNESVSTYPSIALTEDTRQNIVLLPLRGSPKQTSSVAASSAVQEEQRQKEGDEPQQQQQQLNEQMADLNLRKDDDDISIPLDDDEVSEMNSNRRYSSHVGAAVNNVSSITASHLPQSSGIAASSGVNQDFSRAFEGSRVDSESTFSVDTNTNPRRLRKRREYNQRIQELLLQVEEEKLYVLRQKELILKLEKSSTKQRHGYILEINSLKTELAKCQEDQKQVSNELSKRELKLKMQTLTLRQLRTAYDELLEGHKQLLATKDTLEKAGMSNPIPTLKSLLVKAHPPAEAIIEPRPPTVTRPSSTGNETHCQSCEDRRQ